MTAYQSGIAKFGDANAEVIGISTDNLPTLRHWAEEHLKTTFPLASDFMRKVSASYGVLNDRGMASRTTFVIDMEGKIQHIDFDAGAIDPTGAVTACSRVQKK